MRKPKLHYAWVIVGAGVIGVMASLGLGRFSYAVILPAMKDALELNYGQMGLLGTGNLAGYLCFSLFGGFLASRYGTKIVIVLSLVFMTITLMLTGMAGGFYGTLAARIFTGVGSAGANVPIMGLASAWFSTRRRGLAAGILVSGSGLGVLLTGIFLPEVIKAYGADGWRWAWYYLAALSLVITLICQLLLKDTPAEKNLPLRNRSGSLHDGARPGTGQQNNRHSFRLGEGVQEPGPMATGAGLLCLRLFLYCIRHFFPRARD